jgi:hypothetical protein
MDDGKVDDPGFLARWSRRKALARQGVTLTDPPAPAAATDAAAPTAAAQPVAPISAPSPPEIALPSMDDVDALAPGAEVSRFVAPGVDPKVRNAALKKLFADPHFNQMDGLDTYVEDFGRPDPLPAAMLRRMVQSTALGLVDPDPALPAAADRPGHPAPPPTLCDEDPDLRLQPHDAAGPSGAGPGPGPDAGRER